MRGQKESRCRVRRGGQGRRGKRVKESFGGCKEGENVERKRVRVKERFSERMGTDMRE